MVLHFHPARNTSYTQMDRGQVQCPHFAPLPKEPDLTQGVLSTQLAI